MQPDPVPERHSGESEPGEAHHPGAAPRPAHRIRPGQVEKSSPFGPATLYAAKPSGDLYHRALRLSWPRFVALLCGGFLLLNASFALLYMAGGYVAGGAPIAGARPGSFTDLFFFSVQTLATIGYGQMYPSTLYGHVLVTVEALIGLMGVGFVAAIAFARFALPRSRVRFSATAVLRIYDGAPTLMVRAANERHDSIVDAHAQLSLLRTEVTPEGERVRRFHELALVRPQTPMFMLSWLIQHRIGPDSPLHGVTPATLPADSALLLTITGLDETLSATVHARKVYFVTDLRWDHRFVDMIQESERGGRVVDLGVIDATEPLGEGLPRLPRASAS